MHNLWLILIFVIGPIGFLQGCPSFEKEEGYDERLIKFDRLLKPDDMIIQPKRRGFAVQSTPFSHSQESFLKIGVV